MSLMLLKKLIRLPEGKRKYWPLQLSLENRILINGQIAGMKRVRVSMAM